MREIGYEILNFSGYLREMAIRIRDYLPVTLGAATKLPLSRPVGLSIRRTHV